MSAHPLNRQIILPSYPHQSACPLLCEFPGNVTQFVNVYKINRTGRAAVFRTDSDIFVWIPGTNTGTPKCNCGDWATDFEFKTSAPLTGAFLSGRKNLATVPILQVRSKEWVSIQPLPVILSVILVSIPNRGMGRRSCVIVREQQCPLCAARMQMQGAENCYTCLLRNMLSQLPCLQTYITQAFCASLRRCPSRLLAWPCGLVHLFLLLVAFPV